MKIILTDVDDAVLDCSSALEKFCTHRLNCPPRSSIRDVYYVDKAFDVDPIDVMDIIHQFWESDYMATLSPEPAALAVLPSLYQQGYSFIAISACSDTAHVRQARMKNLETVFGFPWEGLYCTHGQKKSDVLKLFSPTFWVEDNWENCQAGALVGHDSFLLHREHNRVDQETPKFTRVSDWYDIARHISARFD